MSEYNAHNDRNQANTTNNLHSLLFFAHPLTHSHADYTLNTAGSLFDTVMSLHTDPCGAAIACSDNYQGSDQSFLQVALQADRVSAGRMTEGASE